MLPQVMSKVSFAYLAHCPTGCRKRTSTVVTSLKWASGCKRIVRCDITCGAIRKTTPLEAHQKSKEYIWDHLFWAWSGMRKGVYHRHKWYDKIHDSSTGDFDKRSEASCEGSSHN